MNLVLKRTAFLLGLLAVPNPGMAAERPNVLLLMTDDQRPDTIHALGNRAIRTPNLDRLVQAGMACTRAVSPNPLCVPSRAEVLTGCSGFRNGVLPPYSHRLDANLSTWPEAMRSAGYRTAYVGKWHTEGRPSARGYAESLALFGGGGPTTPVQRDHLGREITGYVGWVFQTDDGRHFPEQGVGLTPNINARFADAAIAFLERPADEPFFLHVNFTGPHDPLLPPPGLEGVYDPSAIPLPANYLPEHPFDHGNLRGRDELLWPARRTPEVVRRERALYYAVITHLDEQVGRILAALERTGRRERTLVVFTSDHGLAIGSHGLRGKQNMYEHTVGVPLIVAGPGVAAGRLSRAQVLLRDLFPTICELAGVPVPAGVEGRSFAGVLRGEADRARERIFGYFADSQRMVRGERWKLIWYPKLAREQLFDLVADPDECHDRAEDPAVSAIRAELRAALHGWRQRVGDRVGDG